MYIKCIKSITILCLIIFISLQSTAQGNFSFTSFPDTLQLYARDVNTNLASVSINGNDDSNLFTSTELNVYRESILIHNQTDALNYIAGEAEINIQFDITAELANYTFELFAIDANGISTLIDAATNVVAGDVLIIDGQSNAECRMRTTSAAAYQNDFIRVFSSGTQYSNQLLSTLKWFIGNVDGDRNTDGNTGQWGAKLAAEIIANQQIPVAVFNGAHGGTPISFHQKNDLNPFDLETNYGRLLHRLNYTGLANAVRAIYWYQGESNANAGMLAQDYYNAWQALYDDWKLDFPNTEQFYIHQIRLGCNGTPEKVVEIQDAQFNLAQDIADVQITTAKGIPFHTDNCHYDFIGGSEEIGNRFYKLLDRDIYNNQSQTDIDAPQPALAYFSGANQITLELQHENDSYTFESGTEAYFEFSDTSNSITNFTYDGSFSFIIDMLNPVSNLTSFTFFGFGGAGITTPSLKNANNIGMVSFKDFPIVDCSNLIANATITDVSCFDANDGEATISISGGASPYNIIWSNNATTTQINNLAPSTYTYNYWDANGCYSEDSVEIIEPSELVLSAFFVDESVSGANDGVINLAVNGGAMPYTYNWSHGPNYQDVNNLAPGDYTVIVTDNIGCSASYSVTILAGAIPCVVPTNLDVSNIQNTSATLSWQTDANDVSYEIEYKELSSNTWITFNSNVAFAILNNLLACTVYEIRIKANCPSAQASSFSNNITFETTGCIEPCANIQGLFSQNVTSASAFLVWDIVPNATYTMYYRAAGNANWFSYPTPFPIAILFTLPACTDFEWYVEVNCTNGQISTPSPIEQFSTTGAACKNDNNISNTIIEETDFKIYPNPALSDITISFNSELYQNISINIYDSNSQLIHSSKHNATASVNNYNFDVSWLSKGSYFVEIISTNERLIKQFIKI